MSAIYAGHSLRSRRAVADERGEVHRDRALARELRRCPVANLFLRLDRRVRVHKDGACWVYLGSHDEEGYARIWWEGRNWHLNRALMTALGGELERWQHVHHTCENAWCCNPAHMEVLHWKAHHRRHGWCSDDEAIAAD